MLRKKPVIALLEPETSDIHGGVTERQCREILRGEKILDGPGGKISYAERLQVLEEEVSSWTVGWNQPGLKLPTVKEIEDTLFASAPLDWSPLADVQLVTLRMVAERLLPGFQHLYGRPYKQIAYARGEIGERLHETTLKPPDQADPQLHFHLFCSRHTPGARAIAEEIAVLLREAQLPPLLWTEDPDELEQCDHVLVHLNAETWTRGAESDAFARDVCDAMRLGVHRLLAHEVPGARLDNEARGGCSFDDIIHTTPEHLNEAGIYSEIAMNLAGGAWRTAVLVKLIKEISKSGGPRTKWMVEPREPDPVVARSSAVVDSALCRSDCLSSEVNTETNNEGACARRPSLLPRGSNRRPSCLQQEDLQERLSSNGAKKLCVRSKSNVCPWRLDDHMLEAYT